MDATFGLVQPMLQKFSPNPTPPPANLRPPMLAEGRVELSFPVSSARRCSTALQSIDACTAAMVDMTLRSAIEWLSRLQPHR
eukprot:scaffold20918_cov15-Tisochrysis_lutea.AAC.1